MKRLVPLVLVVAASSVAPSTASAASPMTGLQRALALPAAPAASCKAGSRRAVIAGKRKCLKAGHSCTSRHSRQYRRYGFVCRNGRLAARRTATKPPAPLTAAETAWGASIGTWGQSYLADLNAKLQAVQTPLRADPAGFVLAVRANEPPAATLWTDMLNALRNCTPSLSAVGQPPTSRFRAGYNLLVQACAKFGHGADLWDQGIQTLDVSLVEQGTMELETGAKLLVQGVEALARAAGVSTGVPARA